MLTVQPMMAGRQNKFDWRPAITDCVRKFKAIHRAGQFNVREHDPDIFALFQYSNASTASKPASLIILAASIRIRKSSSTTRMTTFELADGNLSIQNTKARGLEHRGSRVPEQRLRALERSAALPLDNVHRITIGARARLRI